MVRRTLMYILNDIELKKKSKENMKSRLKKFMEQVNS